MEYVEALFKFGTPYPMSQPYAYPNVWAESETTAGTRLVIAPAKAQIDAIIRLLEVMPEPMWLLYVHVVSRTTHKPGRYQSPEPNTREAVRRFLKQFEAYLETDGRHHLWIAAANSQALLVYDRHDVIYGYGPLDEFKVALAELKFDETPEIPIPDPHSHHYHQAFDLDAEQLFKLWNWHQTSLLESDSL